ncbi:MAG: DUF4263 domain-containing protein [Candidatus Electrothrix sp. AW1]|nr:DUF4263 domain-containing protein [Candidatus Electrothrix sp. AX1]MCI5182077.1 DUF4263 domain-containing protein [Candidatus Electrothrix gigas]
MAENSIASSEKDLVMTFLNELAKVYYGPLYKYVKENSELVGTMPGFLINHEKIIIYIGRTHIAVEYTGPEVLEELPKDQYVEIQFYDYSVEDSNLVEKIIGFEYDSTAHTPMILPHFSESLLIPTNRGWDKMLELNWNVVAQNSIMAFNTPTPRLKEGHFTRIVNGIFFDADDSGLKARRIKWLDFFPVVFDGSKEETDSFSFNLEKMKELVEADARYSYPMPNDYKFIQLPKINKFIEIWGNRENSETDITSFLSESENQFILTMKFGAKEVHSELKCVWQSELRDAIKPDFFIVQPNGYADIVEFKLPDIEKKSVVGKSNRESFAAWLNSYISQTRVYSTYFEDPNNRTWFEKKYGFKVYKPRRWLVVGRRYDFNSDDWREILSDYNSLDILTFDDLIDGVIVQFYM